jgi:hypothetical protein
MYCVVVVYLLASLRRTTYLNKGIKWGGENDSFHSLPSIMKLLLFLVCSTLIHASGAKQYLCDATAKCGCSGQPTSATTDIGDGLSALNTMVALLVAGQSIAFMDPDNSQLCR